MTKTKNSNEGGLIPAQSALRRGPRIGERKIDTGRVTFSWVVTDFDDKTTVVATNALVETVTAEVCANSGADAPSTKPDVTQYGENAPDAIDTNSAEVVTSKRLNELCISAQTSAQSVIARLAAFINPDMVPTDVSEQRNSPSRANRRTESNVKAVAVQQGNGSESDSAGTDAVVEANVDDGSTADSYEGGDAFAPMTVDDEAVPTIVLARGKEYPAPPVSGVEDGGFRQLGLLPLFDIQPLEKVGFLDRYAVNGWLPGDIPLEWTRQWAWRNQFSCYGGYLVKRRGESLKAVRAEFWEKAIRGAKRL